ncbi:MAG: triose-phosphate isomerase [Firmicutes bacterium]|jgi:triosephosphate isomerase|nr:triose-phosphate isomerase [Bacillota bacterium]
MNLIIAANWKMHKTVEETKEYVEKFKVWQEELSGSQVIICPPFTALLTAREALFKTAFHLGAQNMMWESEGAYTGEISPLMLRELGVRYVIIGHSERRWVFGETDEQINRKINAALEYNLIPIFCVGETMEDHQSGRMKKVVLGQLREGLKGIDTDKVKNMIIAYEPVWAIGTGVAASQEDAAAAAECILEEIDHIFEDRTRVKILYGGSVNKDNIGDFVTIPGIEGTLVGGASLQADVFAGLIRAANSARVYREV